MIKDRFGRQSLPEIILLSLFAPPKEWVGSGLVTAGGVDDL
jgi:hypothetical protein